MATVKNKSRRRKRYQYKGKKISKGEKRVARFLDSYNINYIREFKFNDCLSELGNPLRFDFYLPTFNLLIEYDGIQHFKPINKYPKAKRSHILTVVHDYIKKVYVEKNNIYFFRISYKDYENIETLLKQFLNIEQK